MAIQRVLIDTGPLVAMLNRKDSLHALACREGITSIFTLDRRDFRVYRDAQGNPFVLIPQ